MKKNSRPQYGTISEYNGTTFRSRYESEIAKFCDEVGIKWEYEPLILKWSPPVKTRYYKVDWRFTLPDGQSYFVESKGLFSIPDRFKMKAVKEQHPDIPIKLLFQNPGLHLSKHVTCEDWANKNGYETLTFESLRNDIARPGQTPAVRARTRKRKHKVKKTGEENAQH